MDKGTLALDIDKTLTDNSHHIPDKVISYLSSVHEMGYSIIFVTGREFVYAMDALSKCNFPFFLGTQNGADLFKFPEKEHLESFYFGEKVAKELEELFEDIEDDFLLYAGFEKGDFCYYRPKRYSEKMQLYLKRMMTRSAKPWKVVETFDISSQKSFPCIKAIGKKENFLDIEPKILKNHSLEFVIIQDPKSDEYQYMLISDARATKGNAIHYFMDKYSLKRPLIAAGDDLNDIKSLEIADIAISMANAPKSLQSKADIIAPVSDECGIIQGLEEAFTRC
ncbi:MAG: hypothetical protein S4CHLAM37_14470 [Chlamydiia bacterium]|nr:hypothetical protein [Chlamydiia bacterium]